MTCACAAGWVTANSDMMPLIMRCCRINFGVTCNPAVAAREVIWKTWSESAPSSKRLSVTPTLSTRKTSEMICARICSCGVFGGTYFRVCHRRSQIRCGQALLIPFSVDGQGYGVDGDARMGDHVGGKLRLEVLPDFSGCGNTARLDDDVDEKPGMS